MSAHAWTLAVVGPFAAGLLSSCDLDPLGLKERPITREYFLVETEAHDFALASRSENGGPVVGEIGWKQPFIIVRSDGDARWQVIDTRTKRRTWISDGERLDNPELRQIQIIRTAQAWKQLKWHGAPKW